MGGMQHLLDAVLKRNLCPSDIDIQEALNVKMIQNARHEVVKRIQAQRLPVSTYVLLTSESARNIRVADVKLGGSVEEGLHWTAGQPEVLHAHAIAEGVAALGPSCKCKVESAIWEPEFKLAR